MKNTYFLCAAIFSSLFLISACSNEQIESVTETQRITATVGMEESPSSKTTYTEAEKVINGTLEKILKVDWSETTDEKFYTCLAPTDTYEGDCEKLPHPTFNWKSKKDGTKAIFETNAPKPEVGNKWFAIYPNPDNNRVKLFIAGTKKPKIQVLLSEQTGKLEDLKNFDILYASCVVTKENQTSPNFSFRHSMAFMKMTLNFPATTDGSLKNCGIYISTNKVDKEADVTFYLKTGKVYKSNEGYINILNFDLKGVNSKTIYLALPPMTPGPGATPPDYTIYVYNTDSEGNQIIKYEGTLTHGSNLPAGVMVNAKVTMVAK